MAIARRQIERRCSKSRSEITHEQVSPPQHTCHETSLSFSLSFPARLHDFMKKYRGTHCVLIFFTNLS
jgi:hypothetical protein